MGELGRLKGIVPPVMEKEGGAKDGLEGEDPVFRVIQKEEGAVFEDEMNAVGEGEECDEEEKRGGPCAEGSGGAYHGRGES